MQKLSIAVITQNEEKNIRVCLESVRWADEIIVVDAESTDDTVKVARQYTDRVFTRQWPGFAQQKQYALDMCRNDWILSLDADETVSAKLADEIQELLRTGPEQDGYLIKRRSYFLGKWIKKCGWYPGYQLRLFRRSKTKVSKQMVHEGFVVDGPVGCLLFDIHHDSHISLSHSIAKLNRYSSLEALDRLARKKVRWYHFLVNPSSTFWIKYISQGGIFEGVHGFLLCWIAAFLKMVLYMKIWYLQHLNADQLSEIKKTIV
ncbi:glycosyltransferase family 2 protein [candidate division KSB1 bacterium]|nr:glycosyltransferase family 2 protein [candidate division KSB1 bacterium]